MWACDAACMNIFGDEKNKSELGRCVADTCVHITYLLLNKSTDVNDLSF